MLNIQIGEHHLTVTLENNSSAQALIQMLSEGPITIPMNDYANVKKLEHFLKIFPEMINRFMRRLEI